MDGVLDAESVVKARIYHRYRIANSDGKRGSIKAAESQLPLPFVSPDDEVRLIDQLLEVQPDESDVLRQDKLKSAVAQEASTFESALTLRNIDRYPGFEEYLARHEAPAKLVVRLFHTDIHNPKQVLQFPAYRVLVPDPDIYLISAPGALAESFLKRLLDANAPKLKVARPKLDLKALSEEGTTQIRGASFRISGRSNLTTAMIFGPDVNEDDSWAEYSNIGQLSYVQLQLLIESQEVKMMVTGRGSILPYGINDVYKELRLCSEVYAKYLKRFEVTEVPLGKSKRKR